MADEQYSSEANDYSPVTVQPADAERVAAVVVNDFELLTETGMEAPWSHNQRVYEIWGIYAHWPEGFLLHMAGPSKIGVMIQSVWRSNEHESTYMAEVGVERYTEVARVLSVDDHEHPADLLPVNTRLAHLSFGPLAEHFVDIGPDLDESAGKQFGTELTAIDILLPSLSAEQQAILWDELDLVDNAAPDLILRIQIDDGTQLRDTQLWKSEDAARAFVEHELLPRVAAIAGEDAEEPVIDYRPIRRLAIGSSEFDPGRFAAAGS